MTTAERLERINGEVRINAERENPWMTCDLFYAARDGMGRQFARMEIVGFDRFDNILSVMLDEIEASLGIYEPELMEKVA